MVTRQFKSTTKITINGQSYNSLAEVPEDLRKQLDANDNGVLDVFEGRGGALQFSESMFLPTSKKMKQLARNTMRTKKLPDSTELQAAYADSHETKELFGTEVNRSKQTTVIIVVFLILATLYYFLFVK